MNARADNLKWHIFTIKSVALIFLIPIHANVLPKCNRIGEKYFFGYVLHWQSQTYKRTVLYEMTNVAGDSLLQANTCPTCRPAE